ncbi:hypothetical protein SAMN04488028_102197 [Reichenbachiella agariperforans]|uniref:Uncharacterized protein n=1 Tax=Reichenbachiella agariperforans TaxID=156994 RepID=A0A1M6NC88_REIAG|nr:hypothetical protein [Reichenbachiella agariperforans]SHJ93287.1 hypothetical protein SAMN04488028_102197 [Reichenbachiella agariperforans]
MPSKIVKYILSPLALFVLLLNGYSQSYAHTFDENIFTYHDNALLASERKEGESLRNECKIQAATPDKEKHHRDANDDAIEKVEEEKEEDDKLHAYKKHIVHGNFFNSIFDTPTFGHFFIALNKRLLSYTETTYSTPSNNILFQVFIL